MLLSCILRLAPDGGILYSDLFFSDYDECEKENGGCEHACSNLVGSYFCHCNYGYLLNPDKRTCQGTRAHLVKCKLISNQGMELGGFGRSNWTEHEILLHSVRKPCQISCAMKTLHCINNIIVRNHTHGHKV